MLHILFSAIPGAASARRRARRGRPQSNSTVAGRLLEQDAQGEQIRKRELHERRLRILDKEEEIGNALLQTARAKGRIAQAEEEAIRRKLALDISAALSQEKKSQWEEQLAKRKYELFLRSHPELAPQ